MEESEFVNGWIATGEARGEARGLVQVARSMVLRLGKKRFGPAPAGVEAAIQGKRPADHVIDTLGIVGGTYFSPGGCHRAQVVHALGF